MPKRLPPNNRPWPRNLLYDFGLPETVSDSETEAFISSLPTTERNKSFLRLRYREGKLYDEIAREYDITSAGVRGAVKMMWERFSPTATSASPAPYSTAPHAEHGEAVPGDAVPRDAAPGDTVAAMVDSPPPVRDDARPLSINLANVRRTLGLTPEEFARPIPIDDGRALITRLETGFSKPAAEVLQLICEVWGIRQQYLLTGRGEMFEPSSDYCTGVVRLLKKYLSVATFDRKGRQYWKGSLVDDLGRLINVAKLNGREMCRVVRTLYDFLDVEQFGELLERMGQ